MGSRNKAQAAKVPNAMNIAMPQISSSVSITFSFVFFVIATTL